MLRIYISIPYYADPKNLDNEPCGRGVRECLASKDIDFGLNIANGTYINRNRNNLVLTPDSYDKNGWIDLDNYKIKECDYFLFIDHDIDFNLNDVLTLLKHDKLNIGLPYKKRGSDEYCLKTNGNCKSLDTVQCMGMGFRLIKRDVFVNIKPLWFETPTIRVDRKLLEQSEDYDFDSKCQLAGIDIWCDFKQPVKHITGATKMEQQKMTASQIARAITNQVNNLADAVDQLNQIIVSKDAEIKEKDLKIKDLESK